MTKEKAIMEIISNAKQVEALESCIRILSGWTTLEDLVVELKKKGNEIEEQSENLYDVVVDGKFSINKAF